MVDTRISIPQLPAHKYLALLKKWNELEYENIDYAINAAKHIAHEAQLLLDAYSNQLQGLQIGYKNYTGISTSFPTISTTPTIIKDIIVSASFKF